MNPGFLTRRMTESCQPGLVFCCQSRQTPKAGSTSLCAPGATSVSEHAMADNCRKQHTSGDMGGPKRSNPRKE